MRSPPQSVSRAFGRFRYLLFALAGLPLAMCTGARNGHAAFLRPGTATPYLLASGSALLMTAAAYALFDRQRFPARSFLSSLLFTAVVAIPLLFGVQSVAEQAKGVAIREPGGESVFWGIAKFIGFCYRVIHDPDAPFALMLFGFVFGVGLCEEVAKALPVLYHQGMACWQHACLAGLASGIGFGVAEGVLYCVRDYDGVAAAPTYVVRFVSCVGFHATLTAAASLRIHKARHDLFQWDGLRTLGFLVLLLFPVYFLHGLYDALLTADRLGWAVAANFAAYVWLFWRIESARRPSQTEPGKTRAASSHAPPELSASRPGIAARLRPDALDPVDAELERLLQKIYERGIGSLAPAERDYLQRVSTAKRDTRRPRQRAPRRL